ncbi:MAG: GntR family transcriptional regulator [Polyangiaceae bacterium]|nr:GntR family transcriptional regulator [Polyangiaceae bacterium]
MDEPALGANIASTIFRELRSHILRGELQPGERLPGERELAHRFHTNRNTLREAVRKLEQARLVTVRHGQGVTIADFRETGTMELLPPFLESTTDPLEVARILEDILPARLLVIEFAARLACKRADKSDLERVRDITDLVITAFHGGDATVIARGFQRWMDAVIDAGHSVAVRWIANPFLEAYRDLIDRFPSLWVLDPSFPRHLQEFLSALAVGDEERAIEALRHYYRRIDGQFMRVLEETIGTRPAREASSPRAASEPPPRAG